MDARLVIGTRGSPLALAQARLVAAALERAGVGAQLVVIETDGDRRAPDTAWGEGAFVAAIAAAVLDGRVDVAVHSAKDVPTDQDERLRIGAYLPRADPRDALVVRGDATARTLVELPAGTRVGTDSPRRTGFVRAIRPDLLVHPLHGNVDTRLRRLDAGETDALVLACAGLDRLGLGDRIAERIDPGVVPPAPGQGAIAVQIRAEDVRTTELTAAIDDTPTRLAVEAERAFLATAGGGCRAPIGMLAIERSGRLEMIGGVADPEGSEATIVRREAPLAAGIDAASRIARELRPLRRSDRAEGRSRVIVTRSADQCGDLIAALDAEDLEALPVPSISIELEPGGGDLDRLAGSLQLYDWIVVTSANGARALLEAAERVLAELAAPRWAAVGAATAETLGREGIEVAFVPSTPDADALARELPIGRGSRVLVVRGHLAGTGVGERLRARGATVDDVVGYRTRIAPVTSESLLRAALASHPAGVVLTSGSTVDGLVELGRAIAGDVTALPAICIGPRTRRSAIEAGFQVVAQAPTADASALAKAARRALEERAVGVR